MSSIQIRVGGTWLAAIGGWGELTWSTVADGGVLEQATWRMNLPRSYNHPALVAGELVELKCGPSDIGSGILAEPDISDSGWQFTAIGLADELHGYLCLDSGGNTTSTPDTAIDQAIADGFPGTRPTSISAVPFAGTDETDALNYVDDLLDAWAPSVSQRWRVQPDRTIVSASDPTTPSWYMAAGTARVGLADDDYASDLYLRYRSSATGYATVHVFDTIATAARRRSYPVDLTSLGVITSGKATSIGNGMLARGKARFAWTAPVTPSAQQLTTPGGQPAYLPFVQAGDMVRSHNVLTQQGLILPYLDWIIGRTEYEDGADTIQLAPVQLAARNLGDILSLAVA